MIHAILLLHMYRATCDKKVKWMSWPLKWESLALYLQYDYLMQSEISSQET